MQGLPGRGRSGIVGAGCADQGQQKKNERERHLARALGSPIPGETGVIQATILTDLRRREMPVVHGRRTGKLGAKQNAPDSA